MADHHFTETDVAEIRALFLRQGAAETAHDIDGMNDVLATAVDGQADPVNFVGRAYRFWGRGAVLEHFASVFEETWRFEPEAEHIKVSAINQDVAHIYAPTSITIGTPDGWRISTIVPVPAQ
jgi:hypothetical protein